MCYKINVITYEGPEGERERLFFLFFIRRRRTKIVDSCVLLLNGFEQEKKNEITKTKKKHKPKFEKLRNYSTELGEKHFQL